MSVKLKFMFANVDGVKLELDAAPNMTILEVKRWIINEWDKLDPPRDPAADPEGIRIICMGAQLDENKTIEACKLPKFPHATPINVSMLPKGQQYSKPASISEAPVGKKPTPPTANSACCVIL